MFSHDPSDGVGDIRFAAAVGPYNGGDIAAKGHNGFIREGLKALDFDCL